MSRWLSDCLAEGDKERQYNVHTTLYPLLSFVEGISMHLTM